MLDFALDNNELDHETGILEQILKIFQLIVELGWWILVVSQFDTLCLSSSLIVTTSETHRLHSQISSSHLTTLQSEICFWHSVKVFLPLCQFGLFCHIISSTSHVDYYKGHKTHILIDIWEKIMINQAMPMTNRRQQICSGLSYYTGVLNLVSNYQSHFMRK